MSEAAEKLPPDARDFRIPDLDKEKENFPQIEFDRGITEKYPDISFSEVPQSIDKIAALKSDQLIQLDLGRKSLILIHDPKENSFNIRLDNTRGEETRKKGETTRLYTAARDVMQSVSDHDGKEKEFTMITWKPVLYEFMKTRGDEIFDWDKIGERDNNNYRYFAEKNFRPKERKENWEG